MFVFCSLWRHNDDECSDVDEYGFKRDPNFDYTAYESIMTNYYTTLTRRRIKWESLMKNPPNFSNNKSRKLKRYIRKGIPGESKSNVEQVHCQRTKIFSFGFLTFSFENMSWNQIG